MKVVNRPRILVIVIVFIVLVACPRIGAQTKPRQIVLKGARLIDGTGRPAIENSVLVIEGDHIVAAGRAGTVSIPPNAACQDVRGKQITPGTLPPTCPVWR